MFLTARVPIPPAKDPIAQAQSCAYRARVSPPSMSPDF